ncbi:MAG: hypothetical protein QGH93_00415 [Gammaproteobacteria bacterium]|jgi:hypothetical protein|nr:hypothetical protein [Gammaproteobacteria bacterium]
MAKIKHSEAEFANEHTVRRRASIAKALDSVRGRFEDVVDDCHLSEDTSKPHLFVVKTDDMR